MQTLTSTLTHKYHKSMHVHSHTSIFLLLFLSQNFFENERQQHSQHQIYYVSLYLLLRTASGKQANTFPLLQAYIKISLTFLFLDKLRGIHRPPKGMPYPHTHTDFKATPLRPFPHFPPVLTFSLPLAP